MEVSDLNNPLSRWLSWSQTRVQGAVLVVFSLALLLTGVLLSVFATASPSAPPRDITGFVYPLISRPDRGLSLIYSLDYDTHTSRVTLETLDADLKPVAPVSTDVAVVAFGGNERLSNAKEFVTAQTPRGGIEEDYVKPPLDVVNATLKAPFNVLGEVQVQLFYLHPVHTSNGLQFPQISGNPQAGYSVGSSSALYVSPYDLGVMPIGCYAKRRDGFDTVAVSKPDLTFLLSPPANMFRRDVWWLPGYCTTKTETHFQIGYGRNWLPTGYSVAPDLTSYGFGDWYAAGPENGPSGKQLSGIQVTFSSSSRQNDSQLQLLLGGILIALSGIPKVLFVTRWQPWAGPGRGGG
jgi:hypothetical protein